MTPRELARSLAEGLAGAGVTRIFGIPGGGPNLDMIGAAAELGIEFVLAHGETAACVMAASYGRATGTPGVAIVTRGPGFTSAANGLAQATLDRYPLVLISDSVTAGSAHRTAHQRLDQVATAAPITKWSGVLGTADPAAVVLAASALALTAPAGAVHLAFDPTTRGDVPPEVPVRPQQCDPTQRDRAIALLTKAKRPIVVIGLDAAPHAPLVREALRGVGAPILTTYEAKGVVPESWPEFAGLFTGAALERRVLEHADVILGVGLDAVESMPGPWDYTAAVVLLHSYAVETAYFGDPVLVTGSYNDDLPQLLSWCAHSWPAEFGVHTRNRDTAELEWESARLTPQEVVSTTREVVGDVPLAVDAGAHMLVAMPLWQTDEAGGVQISNGLATMGFSVPASIALALASPDKRVVAFVGDGGMGMALAELETIARLDLNITVVVFNDSTLSLIKLKQGQGQGGRNAIGFNTVDFAQVAYGMGVRSAVVESAPELRKVLESGPAGPLLIDARVDPDAYPHVISVIRGR